MTCLFHLNQVKLLPVMYITGVLKSQKKLDYMVRPSPSLPPSLARYSPLPPSPSPSSSLFVRLLPSPPPSIPSFLPLTPRYGAV